MKEVIYTHWRNRSIEDIEGEIWKPIPNTNGTYFASSFGRIKSVIRREYYTYENGELLKHICPMILGQTKTSGGYLAVGISYKRKEKATWRSVHRVICEAFKEKPEGKNLVHHIKNERSYNVVENLMWVDEQENMDFKTEGEEYEVVDIVKANNAPRVPSNFIEKGYTCIYGILDTNKEVIYIGKSDNPPKRFREHRRTAKNESEYWLNEWINDGHEIDFKILKVCPKREWEKWEKYYISEYRKINPNLANVLNGGNGFYMTPEVRSRGDIKRRKKVLQYSREGEFIQEWDSVLSAATFAGVGSASMTGTIKLNNLTANCQWLFKEGDAIPETIPPYDSLKGLPILQYSLKGDFIKEWDSCQSAHLALSVATSQVYVSIRTGRKTAAKSLWRLKDSDSIADKIKVTPVLKTFKPIFQVLNDGSKVSWPSIKEASESLGISSAYIREAIRENKKAKGFSFEKDLSSERWHHKHGKLMKVSN